MRLVAIAAMGQNRVIGKEGRIPWHIREELQWFKQRTWGHALVMGRRTFESIGHALPGREIYVLSRSGFSYAGVRVIRSLAELRSEPASKIYFLCGGASIYAQFLPHCEALYLSIVNIQTDGDAYFPPFEHLFRFEGEIIRHPQFVVNYYVNPNPLPLE